MRVSIETVDGLTRKMTIAVPSATLESEVAEQVKEAAGNVKLPGFRPGKVPLSEVRRRFEPQLRQQVATGLLESSLKDAVREQDLAMASQASVEILKLEAGNDFEFTATFEVFPEFDLVDFGDLTVRRPVAEISDEDVDAMVENLRQQRVEWNEVEREAGEGDRLKIDYALTVNGEVVTDREGRSLIVGSEGLLPELDGAVRGMTGGETRAFPAVLPPAPGSDASDHDHDHADHDHADQDQPDHDQDHADHDHDQADQGDDRAHDEPGYAAGAAADPPQIEDSETSGAAEAEAEEEEKESPPDDSRQAIGTVTVHAVEEASLPELDDAFFDQFNVAAAEEGGSRLDLFRADVRERMQLELDSALREAQRREVLQVLARRHRFELPKAMVEGELAREREQLSQVLGNVPEDVSFLVPLAEQRVREQLAVNRVVTTLALTPDDDRVRERIDQISSGYEQSAEVRRTIFADENHLASIEASVLQDQAVDRVLGEAQVEDVTAAYADVMQGRALPETPLPVADDQADADEVVPGAADQAVGESAPEAEAEAGAADDATGIRGRFKRMFGGRKRDN